MVEAVVVAVRGGEIVGHKDVLGVAADDVAGDGVVVGLLYHDLADAAVGGVVPVKGVVQEGTVQGGAPGLVVAAEAEAGDVVEI